MPQAAIRAAVPKRIALIINPTAGRGRAGRAIPAIRNSFESHNADTTYYYTSARGEGEWLAKQAIEAGAEVAVAVGGDGTLHEVTNAVMSAPKGSVALGLIPFGTGNDFARGVGLYGDLQKACDAVVTGRLHHIDIGWIEGTGLGSGRWFLVAAGLGFVADIAKTVNEGVRFLHGAPAYIFGAAKTLRHLEPFPLSVAIDGEPVDMPLATLISVSNVETTGGGLKIAPNASPEDGALDICLVGEISRGELLKQLPHVAKGTHIHHPAVRMVRAKSIEIVTKTPKALWIDGEVVGETPASFTIHQGALPMMLP